MAKTAKHVFFVEGEPKAQPRPRLSGRGGHAYDPGSADGWKASVRAAIAGKIKPAITRPVRLKVRFFMPVPKGAKAVDKEGRFVPHAKKPDADNLLKAVMDAITESGAWADDSQAFWTEATKWLAYHKPGAEITIEEWV